MSNCWRAVPRHPSAGRPRTQRNSACSRRSRTKAQASIARSAAGRVLVVLGGSGVSSSATSSGSASTGSHSCSQHECASSGVIGGELLALHAQMSFLPQRWRRSPRDAVSVHGTRRNRVIFATCCLLLEMNAHAHGGHGSSCAGAAKPGPASSAPVGGASHSITVTGGIRALRAISAYRGARQQLDDVVTACSAYSANLGVVESDPANLRTAQRQLAQLGRDRAARTSRSLVRRGPGPRAQLHQIHTLSFALMSAPSRTSSATVAAWP
jgi:hypothetical protein